MYQTAKRYTPSLSNIPNGHKMYQHFTFQSLPNYSQIGIFRLNRNHLATLIGTMFGSQAANVTFVLFSKKLPPYTPAGFDLTTLRSKVLGGRRRQYRLLNKWDSSQSRGAYVMITIFGDFLQFSATKLAFYLPNQFLA
jgi:hypothetical protein